MRVRSAASSVLRLVTTPCSSAGPAVIQLFALAAFHRADLARQAPQRRQCPAQQRRQPPAAAAPPRRSCRPGRLRKPLQLLVVGAHVLGHGEGEGLLTAILAPQATAHRREARAARVREVAELRRAQCCAGPKSVTLPSADGERQYDLATDAHRGIRARTPAPRAVPRAPARRGTMRPSSSGSAEAISATICAVEQLAQRTGPPPRGSARRSPPPSRRRTAAAAASGRPAGAG